MAIVSCPECGKKLKIADASVGKKVKGPCGHVFVAQGSAAVAPPAPAVAPEKVYVACTECGAKLKVGTTSLGKKMKCPKCAAVFVASLPDEEPAPKPKAKPKPAVSDDDMDDLLAFAQADDANGTNADDGEDLFKDEPVKSRAQRKMDDEEADDEPKPRGKARPKMDDEDDDLPMPKGKKPAKPPRFGRDEDEEPARPMYPSRLIPNILAALLLLAFGGLVGAIFFDIDVATELGLPEAKVVARPPQKLDGDKKGANAQKDAANKKEAAKLYGVWIVTSAEMPGASLDAMKGMKFVFADGIVTTPDPLVAPFSVDASHDPKWINLPTTAKVSAQGIYLLDGDTLQWCTALPQKKKLPDGKEIFAPGERPKKLDATQGVLVVLTREKKTETTDPPETSKDREAAKDKEISKDKDKEATKDKDNKDVSEEVKAARAQIKALTQAAQAYALRNNGEYPKALQDLVDSKPPYLESKDALLDPWKQPFKYDPAGPKNGGAQPDIWTVTPDKMVVGNWPAAKQKGKEADKDKDNSREEKTMRAEAQINVLAQAAEAYRVKHKQYPLSLAELFEKDALGGPYLQSKDALVDPWKNSIQYELFRGGKSGRLKPDIWIETPDKLVIGNWPGAKQIIVLTLAVRTYRGKNNKNPMSLNEFLDKDALGGPYLKSEEALVGPWMRLFQYDPSGPRNNGDQPDIWTESPDQAVIGNWPLATKKGKTGDNPE